MLIAKIFSDDKLIDEIEIQAVMPTINGYHIYEITKPSGEFGTLAHKRSAGHRSLLLMALGELIHADKK